VDAAAPDRMGAIGAPVTGTGGLLGDLSLANDPDGLVRLKTLGLDWHLERSWRLWSKGWGTPQIAYGKLHGLPVRVRLGQERLIRSCLLEGSWPEPLKEQSLGEGWCATGPHWQQRLDLWKKRLMGKGLGNWDPQAAARPNSGSWHPRPWWASWSLSLPPSAQRLLLKWLAEPPDGSRWFRWQPTRWQAMLEAPVDAGYPLRWTEATTAVARSLFAQLGGEVRFADRSAQSADSLREGAEKEEEWRCPICGMGDWPQGDAGPRQACDRCGTLAHRSCREFLGRCSLFGCGGNPKP
jgi:hypothetical protein